MKLKEATNMFGISQTTKGNVSIWFPGQIDEKVGECYRMLVTLKLEMDEMEELPNFLKELYKQTLALMDSTRKLREKTDSLKREINKIQRYR